jgi:hypothetical protein
MSTYSGKDHVGWLPFGEGAGIESSRLRAIYPDRRLSQPDRKHKKYLRLLKDKAVWLPNQV